MYYRARKNGLQNIVKKDPSRFGQTSLATAGINFTKPRTSHFFGLCTLKLAQSLSTAPLVIGTTVWMDKQGRILLARYGIVNGGWPLPRCHRRARPRFCRALPRAQIDRPLGSKAAAVTMEISAHIVSLQSTPWVEFV